MNKDNESDRPSIGVAVVVTRDNKILIGKDMRKGESIYGVPGGHWENNETLKECATREVNEESGVECADIELISVYDFYREDKSKSYVTIGMKAKYLLGDLKDLEKEGRLEWDWYFPKQALKLNLFPADRVLIERYLSGIIFE